MKQNTTYMDNMFIILPNQERNTLITSKEKLVSNPLTRNTYLEWWNTFLDLGWSFYLWYHLIWTL